MFSVFCDYLELPDFERCHVVLLILEVLFELIQLVLLVRMELVQGVEEESVDRLLLLRLAILLHTFFSGVGLDFAVILGLVLRGLDLELDAVA